LRRCHDRPLPNLPEVAAEARQLFERYETALETKNVAVLDATFWISPNTIRYALQENGYGRPVARGRHPLSDGSGPVEVAKPA
jgi:hypothetical protein